MNATLLLDAIGGRSATKLTSLCGTVHCFKSASSGLGATVSEADRLITTPVSVRDLYSSWGIVLEPSFDSRRGRDTQPPPTSPPGSPRWLPYRLSVNENFQRTSFVARELRCRLQEIARALMRRVDCTRPSAEPPATRPLATSSDHFELLAGPSKACKVQGSESSM